jgi:hypothetical protein
VDDPRSREVHGQQDQEQFSLEQHPSERKTNLSIKGGEGGTEEKAKVCGIAFLLGEIANSAKILGLGRHRCGLHVRSFFLPELRTTAGLAEGAQASQAQEERRKDLEAPEDRKG